MSEEKTASGPKKVIYIIVPELNKPIFKGRVFVSQKQAVTEGGQQISGEVTDVLSPDGLGMYVWSDDNENHKARVKAMEAFKEKKNKGRETPFVLGPFDDRGKALKAMDAKRERKPEEQVATLKSENKAQADEIARLKEQIAKAKKPGNQS